MIDRASSSRLGLGLLAVLGLTACTAAPEPNPFAHVEEAVRNVLVDPASAQFQAITAHPRGGTAETYCGEVNARNRMGGYDGFKRFVFIPATGEVRIDPAFTDLATAMTAGDDAGAMAAIEFINLHGTNCSGVDLYGSRDNAIAAANAVLNETR